MTVQDTTRHEGYIVLPRTIGLGILASVAALLVAGGIAWATLQSRVSHLEKGASADGPKLDTISERTIRMEADLIWIRAAIATAPVVVPRRP